MILALIAVLSLSVTGFGIDPPSPMSGDFDTSGDNPLTTSYIWQGSGDIVIFKLGFSGINNPTGVIGVNSLPHDAELVCAYFGTSGWNDGYHSASVNINGIDLGSMMPITRDLGGLYTLSFYRWDISNLVYGNGNYHFTLSDVENCYVAYIYMIYRLDTLPPVRIVVNEGAESLKESWSETTFPGFDSGSGTVMLLTHAGDYMPWFPELIILNGDTLAGPGNIFIGNADLHQFSVDNLQYQNTLTVYVDFDWIGIQFAALIGEIGYAPEVSITLIPHNPPIQIPATGGEFLYDVAMENTDSLCAGINAWINIILPDGSSRGPFRFQPNICIDADSTMNYYDINQIIPADSPDGIYSLVGKIGICPDYIMDTDTLGFEKLPSENSPSSASGVYLRANPNPFNAEMMVEFEVSRASEVVLKLFDIQGRVVEVIASGHYSTGLHRVHWNGQNISSGIYFLRMEAGDFHSTRKITLLK